MLNLAVMPPFGKENFIGMAENIEIIESRRLKGKLVARFLIHFLPFTVESCLKGSKLKE